MGNIRFTSIIRYKEWSLWGLYKWYIISGIVVVALQGFFIVSLLVQRKRGRQREQQLRASDERYRAFIQNSTEGIWCAEFEQPIDLDLPEDEQFELVYKHGYISEANDAYARHVGFEHGEELVGTRIEEFAPRSVPRNVGSVKAWIRSRYTIIDAETVESYKDGMPRIILNNSSGIIEANRVLRVWGMHRDITTQREIEEGLRQSKDFNHAVLLSLPDHIAVLDRHGTILTVNESWLRFARDNDLGSLERIGPGVNYLEVCRQVSDDDGHTAQSAAEGIESVIKGRRERFELEYPCHAPTEPRWFLISVVPFTGSKGGVIVSHTDISARKFAEDQLSRAEYKYRTVADFTYDWEYWKTQDGSLLFDVHLDVRRLDPIVNRLVYGVLSAALFMGPSRMLSAGVPPLFHGVSALGAGGLILALVFGFRLVRAISPGSRSPMTLISRVFWHRPEPPSHVEPGVKRIVITSSPRKIHRSQSLSNPLRMDNLSPKSITALMSQNEENGDMFIRYDHRLSESARELIKTPKKTIEIANVPYQRGPGSC